MTKLVVLWTLGMMSAYGGRISRSNYGFQMHTRGEEDKLNDFQSPSHDIEQPDHHFLHNGDVGNGYEHQSELHGDDIVSTMGEQSIGNEKLPDHEGFEGSAEEHGSSYDHIGEDGGSFPSRYYHAYHEEVEGHKTEKTELNGNEGFNEQGLGSMKIEDADKNEEYGNPADHSQNVGFDHHNIGSGEKHKFTYYSGDAEEGGLENHNIDEHPNEEIRFHHSIDNEYHNSDKEGYHKYSENIAKEEHTENSINHGEHEETDSKFGNDGHAFTNMLSHYNHNQEPEIHEVTKVIPVHKTIKIPETHKVEKPLKIPVPVKILEPYPVKIPVPVTIEKIVHVPVEKIIKYHVEKPVPVKVEKKIHVPIPKPFPVLVPVYKLKLIIHTDKSKHDE